MLSDFGAFLDVFVQLLSIEFTIYGFTFSFWQILLFNIAAGIVVWILMKLFLD